MEVRSLILKPAGLWMVLGGLLTVFTPMYFIYEGSIDTVLGIIMTLVFILIASYEVGAGKTV